MDDLPRVQVGGAGQGRLDVEGGGVALEHAVGEEDQPVAGLQRERLDGERLARDDAEGRLDHQVDSLHPAVPQPQRQGVAGIDDHGRPGGEIDPHELPGDELTVRGVLGERGIGVARLLGQAEALPASVPERPDQEGGHQGGRHLVTDGIGDGQLQGGAVQGVVEGVPAHLAGRFQPARQGELSGLARVGGWEQAPLDLRGQGERGRALTPLEDVGVPPGGDEDVGERVGSARDVEDLVLGGVARQVELEQADRVAAVGDGHQQARAVPDRLDVGPLGAQDLLVAGARQRQCLGLLGAVRPRSLHRLRGGEPHDGTAAEVSDEESHGSRVDHAPELGRHDLHGIDGSGCLDLLQQRADVDH